MIAKAGTQFNILGTEHKGLYIEDENNVYTCIQQPETAYLKSYYVEDEDNVGIIKKLGTSHSSSTRYKGNGSYVTDRGDEVTRYTITQSYSNAYVLVNGSYTSIGAVAKVQSGTYYRGNGKSGYLRGTSVQAIDYDGTLYEDGGNHTYALYKNVSKILYEKGTVATFPMYKEFSGKVYDAGVTAVIEPAIVTTENCTAITV